MSSFFFYSSLLKTILLNTPLLQRICWLSSCFAFSKEQGHPFSSYPLASPNHRSQNNIYTYTYVFYNTIIFVFELFDFWRVSNKQQNKKYVSPNKKISMLFLLLKDKKNKFAKFQVPCFLLFIFVFSTKIKIEFPHTLPNYSFISFCWAALWLVVFWWDPTIIWSNWLEGVL